MPDNTRRPHHPIIQTHSKLVSQKVTTRFELHFVVCWKQINMNITPVALEKEKPYCSALK